MKVAIADDHQLFVEALKLSLEQNEEIEVVAQFYNLAETLAGIEQHLIDILLLDLSMPIKGKEYENIVTGMDVLEFISIKKLAVKVIVITSFPDLSFFKSCLKKGAKGYILKNESSDCLFEALQSVYLGNQFVSESIQKKLNSFNQEQFDTPDGPVRISKREREILKLISKGYISMEIAKMLRIQKDTVSEYRDVLMKKLGASNAPDLVRIAYKWNILEIE